MIKTKDFDDYELLDASDGERLERVCDYILIRPDPSVLWQGQKNHQLWNDAHARYIRSNKGGGAWEFYKKVSDSFVCKMNDVSLELSLMGFKHVGVFPEQCYNLELMKNAILDKSDIKMLSLFGYTGALSLEALYAGASVTHVDASKGIMSIARNNATLSNLAQRPIRWIVDDAMSFVKREARRQKSYDIIAMDPPSYGRGANKEVWKIEDSLFTLINECKNILSDNPQMVMINTYTEGLSPSTVEYMLSLALKEFSGTVTSYELGLKVQSTSLLLPSGSTCVWTAN